MTRVVNWKRVCLNEQCGGWIFVLAEEGAEGGSSGQEGEAGRAAQAVQGKARAQTVKIGAIQGRQLGVGLPKPQHGPPFGL